MITAQELAAKLFEKFTISPTKIHFETGHRSFFIDDKTNITFPPSSIRNSTTEFVWICDDCSIIASQNALAKIKLEFENWILIDDEKKFQFIDDADKLEFLMTYFS